MYYANGMINTFARGTLIMSVGYLPELELLGQSLNVLRLYVFSKWLYMDSTHQ